MSSKEEANACIDTNIKSQPGSMWPCISEQDLIKGLRQRVENPYKISSGSTDLCGPSAFVHSLASSDPVAYVNAVLSLYKSGRGIIGSYTLRPDKSLRNLPTPEGISSADWIPMVSLRNEDNWFFRNQLAPTKLGSPTLPHTMEKWFKMAGYQKVVNETNLILPKDEANLRLAKQLKEQQYNISLFINDGLVNGAANATLAIGSDRYRRLHPKKSYSVPAPVNHWVNLIADIKIEPDGNISTKVLSWGEEKSITNLPRDAFLSRYFGFVAGKH